MPNKTIPPDTCCSCEQKMPKWRHGYGQQCAPCASPKPSQVIACPRGCGETLAVHQRPDETWVLCSECGYLDSAEEAA